LRRRNADWSYVRRLPLKLRRAVEAYLEEDLRNAQGMSGLKLVEFIEVLRRARIWTG